MCGQGYPASEGQRPAPRPDSSLNSNLSLSLKKKKKKSFGCASSSLWHMVSSSLTRDQTWAPCTGSAES